jgi:hypothetical protein
MMQSFKTLFINTLDLENVQGNKKKEKGEFTKHWVNPNWMSKSLHVKNWLPVVGRPYFSMLKTNHL